MLRRDLSDDGLHPNAAGYKIMAPLAEKAIAHGAGEPIIMALLRIEPHFERNRAPEVIA